MSCELDEAFDNARNNLPEEWKITSLVQDSAGWLVRASHVYFNGRDEEWHNSIAARGGTLTKALNSLSEKLESHAQSTR